MGRWEGLSWEKGDGLDLDSSRFLDFRLFDFPTFVL